MFKRVIVIAFLVLLALPCTATIYLVEPLDQTLSSGEEVFLGKVAKGETLGVIVKKKSDLSIDWSSIIVDESLLPNGWGVESVQSDKTLIALVTIPRDAEVSTQRIKFTAGNASGEMFDEHFYATISVQESLLTASLESASVEALLSENAFFSLVLSNDSIAKHSVEIESSLPNYWFSGMLVSLEPHETRVVEIPVFPHSYGEKDFSFSVSSLKNRESFKFPARLNTRPTLSGMFRAPLSGFSFFSPAMLPYYLINGFLSLLG